MSKLRLVGKDESPRESPDALALARAAAGELGALGAVVDRHAASLHRFVVRSTGGRDAEDVVQTTFVRAMTLASTFDRGAPSARPWLFGIASRVILEHRRAFARLSRALGRLASSEPPPARIETATSDVDRALARLTTAKRVVLVLAEVEGYGCEEIALMLDVPVGTVWTRLHHARREVRASLEEGNR